jgi:hypothetical protein
MPRSLPRRIETAERQWAACGRHRRSKERLLASIESFAARLTDPADPVKVAWEHYAAARAALGPAVAPPEYSPDLPNLLRERRWRCWDHPAVAGAMDSLLEAVSNLTTPPRPGPR